MTLLQLKRRISYSRHHYYEGSSRRGHVSTNCYKMDKTRGSFSQKSNLKLLCRRWEDLRWYFNRYLLKYHSNNRSWSLFQTSLQHQIVSIPSLCRPPHPSWRWTNSYNELNEEMICFPPVLSHSVASPRYPVIVYLLLPQMIAASDHQSHPRLQTQLISLESDLFPLTLSLTSRWIV